LFLLALAFQVYRYWRVSGPVQRAQARWVVFCLALAMAALFILAPAARALVPVLSQPNSPAAADFEQVTGTLFGPVLILLGFWLAILRARLWDIDVLIRRTLVYSALTAVLGGVYFGSVLVLEGLLRGVTGGESPLVIVLSTLLIAALAAPARRRVQQVIDRRFFRRKYDAARTLAAFGQQARDETDLSRLSEQLVGVVQETMQPKSVGLWLK